MKKKFITLFVSGILLSLCSCISTHARSLTSTSEKSSFTSSTTTSSIITTSSSSQTTSEKREAKHNDYANPTFPVINNIPKCTYMADPYVIRDDDLTYYLYCTQTNVIINDEGGQVFVEGPTYKSIDLVHWEYVNNVFEDYSPTWGTEGAGVWAPTLIKLNGQWVYYYSLSTGGDLNPGIGYATSPTPYGPWTHHGKLFLSEEIGVTNSIDPHVIEDNGTIYMVWGSYNGNITMIELTSDGLSLKNGLEYQKEHKIELAGLNGRSGNENYEGSFVLKHDNKYFLLLSTGSCLSGQSSTYHVVCGSSDNITGPYLGSDGKDLFAKNRGDSVINVSMGNVMGNGHCCVIKDDAGDDWIIYHGYDALGENPNYRVLYLDKLIYDDTCYPHVKDYKASNHVTLHGPYIRSLEE